MTEDQITFRTNPAIKSRIEELVKQHQYRNKSDFINQAILLKFQLERIPLDDSFVGPDPLLAFFESAPGRSLLRELLREVRES